MKTPRLGLLMILASLTVISIIIGLLYAYMLKAHQGTVRTSGVALSRALSTVDYAQLVPAPGKRSLLGSLVNMQGNPDIAYAVIVNPAGEKLAESAAIGNADMVPSVAMPTEPTAWIGEHYVRSPSDGRQIHEFFFPALKDGELAGFVRVGYNDRPIDGWSGQISYFGMMALPVFLLTTMFYFMIRREIKPLTLLGEKMEQASLVLGLGAATTAPIQEGGDVTQEIDEFVQAVQSRVSQIQHESASAQTSTRLRSYHLEKAEAALNAIPGALIVIDDACVATFANRKTEALLGIANGDIVGRRPQEWCRDKALTAFLMQFNSTSQHSSSYSTARAATMEYVPEAMADRHLSVAAFPLYSPRDESLQFGVAITFTDVSKEYLARQAGSDFVAQVSHELKTPLNTLSAYSEMLQGYATLTDAERVDAVNVIYNEVARMAALISNRLSISKMETDTLQIYPQRVNLHDLLSDAFDSAACNAHGQGVELQLKLPEDLGSVRLDKELFRIAIDNLLGNAIKYSNPGGMVTLSARILDEDQVRISVSDRGIGISADDCERIFDKYFRSDSDDVLTRSGHGLGLYLARRIVEMHHGTIRVDSMPGKGTEFHVEVKAPTVQLDEMSP